MQTLELEQTLCDVLEHAGRDYVQAIDEIDTLSSALLDDAGQMRAGERLQELAIRTRATESRVRRVREMWQALRTPPDDRLREVMSKQEAILHELIHRIDSVEQLARAARNRLAPHVDASTRTSEMRSAYARSIRQATE
ncbi:MAG: hypothetical protein KDA93_09815 [Planctomycetaceae bacterium]|nr:hypothetical protein [Planctomycetaceae bacterium]